MDKKKCPKCNAKLNFAGSIDITIDNKKINIYYCNKCKWKGRL